MPDQYNILFLGASYGSLFGAKAALAGHSAHLICLPEEAELINSEGAIVRLPVRGLDGPVELNTTKMPVSVSAGAPEDANPSDYDLVVLAMQEPQYRVSVVKDLLSRVGTSGKPCMSIMNLPPLSFLRIIPAVDPDAIRGCYTDPSVWDNVDPSRITLCSPDPQAFRPPEEKVNVLHKCITLARFQFSGPTQDQWNMHGLFKKIGFRPQPMIIKHFTMIRCKCH